MDRKTSNRLLAIAAAMLAVGGLILLLVSIFGETKDYWALNTALAAVFLSNLFNLIRVQRIRKDKRESGTEEKPEDKSHE